MNGVSEKTEHEFIIKDYIGSQQSAEHCYLMLKSLLIENSIVDDLVIKKVYVYINSDGIHEPYNVWFEKYPEYKDIINIEVLPKSILEDNESKSLSIANFHNFVMDHYSEYHQIKSVTDNNRILLHILMGDLWLCPKFNPEEVKPGFKSYLGSFIDDIDEMLKYLNRRVWFGTASDQANYAFGKYFTFVDVLNIDTTKKSFAKLVDNAPDCLMWSGHSNLDWIILDITNREEYSRFKLLNSISMNDYGQYYFLSIKELIARYTKEDGFYTNLFPTIPREVGSYFVSNYLRNDHIKYDFGPDSNYKEMIDLFREHISDIDSANPASFKEIAEYLKDI